MPYNPAKHHRQSIRLKGYDYSSPGCYFLTVCTQNHTILFGEIIKGEMHLNDAGKMIKNWYFEIEYKFLGIKCDEYAIMPNHFHCIIQIPSAPVVRMALRGHPELPSHPESEKSLPHTDSTKYRDAHMGASLREPHPGPDPKSKTHDKQPSIFEIMDWFKTMSTNEYIRGVKTGRWKRFEKRVWQLRYWDHIVRDENDLYRIRQYIKNNPANWDRDNLNGGTGNRVLEESALYGEEPWMI